MVKILFFESSITLSILSSLTILFLRKCLHFRHCCVKIYSPFFSSMSIGFIKPPHSAARSPGLISTCLLHKQFGQWLVYPLPLTFAPQFSQTKSSIFRWNFLAIKKERRNMKEKLASFILLLPVFFVGCVHRSPPQTKITIYLNLCTF